MEAQNISGPDIQSTEFRPSSQVEVSREIPKSEEPPADTQNIPEEGRGANIDTYA